MLVTYILLLVLSGFQVGYEFFMGFACDEHDCMYQILVYEKDKENYPQFAEVVHSVEVFWKLKQ